MRDDLSGRAWPSIPAGPLVLVPLGSTEQHGPHLPFATDTIIASAVADRVRARLASAGEGPVIVAPALAYGASGEHQQFPGTVSIGTGALASVIVELVRSLSTWAARIVIVNGHGGNVAALTASVPLLLGQGHRVGWAPCAAGGADAHAGHTETSVLLHLAPGLVDLTVAAPGATAAIEALLPRLRAGGVRSVSANGVLGDPGGSSAADGAALLAVMCDGVLERIRGGRVDGNGCLRAPAPVVGGLR